MTALGQMTVLDRWLDNRARIVCLWLTLGVETIDEAIDRELPELTVSIAKLGNPPNALALLKVRAEEIKEETVAGYSGFHRSMQQIWNNDGHSGPWTKK